MKRENRHIILFLDNASCHPSSLKGMFSNVQIEFLPKNTTSRTQPLDAGIIKTWKMYYKRKLLRHVASEIDGKKTASEIVKSVNLLMAIRWMVSAWEEVPSEVISKCFKHVGMYPDQETEMDDDPFAGEELLKIEELLSRISPDLDVSFFDVEVDAHEPPVDTTLPNWREKMRNDILGASEGTEASDEESIEESEELKTPEVSSVKGALELSKKLLDFSDWQGDEKLSQAITRVNDALTDLQLKSLKQSSIRSYLS
ncbi:tigger transposable element-derived protein 6-like [Montipora foliosa]|uniref:tigger transposable element-derived protein 6-like n=1 Tax=Montipora foliosa TaxID=591990 RepID=UPI0035F19913